MKSIIAGAFGVLLSIVISQPRPAAADAKTIASDLIGHITTDQVMQWQVGDVPDWAQESFSIAKNDSYGQLPEPNARGSFRLSDDYVGEATQDVSLQLSKAGVRLALILNKVFQRP
jgi:S1/P1 Nuclease